MQVKSNLKVLSKMQWILPLFLITNICLADDALNSLINKVSNQNKSNEKITALENQLLGRLSWQIKCKAQTSDIAKACMMNKGSITVLHFQDQYVVNIAEKLAKNSTVNIRIDEGKTYSAVEGLYRNSSELITEFKKGHEATIQYKKPDNKNYEMKISLVGFTAAFNDMEDQFKKTK